MPMSRLPSGPVVVALTFAALVLAAASAVGCDQLNRPMGSPSSSSSTGGSGSPSTDGGTSDEGGPHLAPAFSPQPGDVQL